MCPVGPRQSPFAAARSSGASTPTSTRAGRAALEPKSGKSSPWATGSWLRIDWGGKGRASGIDLRSSLTVIHTVQDGQIIKIEYFFDHAKALEAAGLKE